MRRFKYTTLLRNYFHSVARFQRHTSPSSSCKPTNTVETFCPHISSHTWDLSSSDTISRQWWSNFWKWNSAAVGRLFQKNVKIPDSVSTHIARISSFSLSCQCFESERLLSHSSENLFLRAWMASSAICNGYHDSRNSRKKRAMENFDVIMIFQIRFSARRRTDLWRHRNATEEIKVVVTKSSNYWIFSDLTYKTVERNTLTCGCSFFHSTTYIFKGRRQFCPI